MVRQADRFVNPYTFIPLARRTAVTGLGPLEDSPAPITGIVHCTLETMRPIAVPGAQPKDGPIPFFRIAGVPAIPGSSLRGCIRSVFEVVTASCVRTNAEYLHSTSGLKNPGLLTKRKDGSYELFDAVRYRVKKDSLARGRKTGDRVRFEGKKGKSSTSGTVTDIESWCHHTGWFLHVNTIDTGEPNHPSVFEQGKSLGVVEARYVEEALCKNIEKYNKKDEETKRQKRTAEEGEAPRNVYAQEYEEAFERMKLGDGMLPVWYGVQTSGSVKSYQFSWAQVSRSVYPVSPKDLVAEKGLSSCTSEKHACPACALFGFIPDGNGDGAARASRVRFSDATLAKGSPCEFIKHSDGMDPYLLPLMEPRQSAFEMYLRNEKYPHAFTPESVGTELAGRKAYWHHQSQIQWGESQQTMSGEQLTQRMEVLADGARFSFNVYVDGVTKEQLNTLLWVLTFGQYWTGGDACWHLIGHGKPVGLGSVRITVESIHTRTVDTQGYRVLDVPSWKMDLAAVEKLFDAPSVRALKRVANHTAIPATSDISYPATTSGGDIFEWFADNRDPFNRQASLPKYAMGLPSVDAPNQTIIRKPSMQMPKSVSTPVPRFIDSREGESELEDKPRRIEGVLKLIGSSRNTGMKYGHAIVDGEQFFCRSDWSPKIERNEWNSKFKTGTRVTFEKGKNPDRDQNAAFNIEFI